jgi:hypothetical protein
MEMNDPTKFGFRGTCNCGVVLAGHTNTKSLPEIACPEPRCGRPVLVVWDRNLDWPKPKVLPGYSLRCL